ncbi:hypothetical protein [Sporomusa termitida]|uniref:hypothetical protein n=1 Tax=Sporomusa termitida TaxID=2377 RepID=UPI001186F506|nr:hypothetical protein [Sporomusa termitida]
MHFRYHRFQKTLFFGEKIFINRHKVKLLAAAAKERKKEWPAVNTVLTCSQFVNQLLSNSLAVARTNLRPFINDVISGAEPFNSESFYRRIVSRDELQRLHLQISRHLSTALLLPVEHCSTVLKGSCQDPVSFLSSTGLIEQYKSTVAITKGIALVAEAIYDQSLAQLQPHWIIKKLINKLNVSTALLAATDCHPVNHEKRCLAEIESCLAGSIESFYHQLRHHYLSKTATLIYSFHDAHRQMPPRHLYLVKKPSQ